MEGDAVPSGAVPPVAGSIAGAGGSTPLAPRYEPAAILGGLYGDGIIALKGAFEREWAERLREDIDVLFDEGLLKPAY